MRLQLLNNHFTFFLFQNVCRCVRLLLLLAHLLLLFL